MEQGDLGFTHKGIAYTIELIEYEAAELFQLELRSQANGTFIRKVSYDVGAAGGMLPLDEETRVKFIARFIELCDHYFDKLPESDDQDPEVLFRRAMEKHIQIDETGRPRFV